MSQLRKSLSGGRALVIAGALIGFILIMYGVWRLAANSRPPVNGASTAPAPEVTQVVTAAKPLVRGQLIQASDLKSTSVVGAAPAGAVTTLADANGKVAIVDIQPQQLILTTLISADVGAAGLAMLVPVGQRVVSTDITDDIAVGGFIRPGDIVDIEIVLPQDVLVGQVSGADRSESRTLLQNIRILTVGTTLGQPGGKDSEGKDRPAARSLTLAMNPDQVAPFLLARKLGHFFLLLRNPKDSAVVPDGRATLASLRGRGAPAIFAPRAAAPVAAAAPQANRPPPPARAIEVIVAGQRQLIYPAGGVR